MSVIETPAATAAPAEDPLRGPVTVVLGGGGAKGFVHVGVLDAITQHNLEIGAIVGTSMGALIGALFAYRVHQSTATTLLDKQRHAIGAIKTLFRNESLGDLLDIGWTAPLRRGFVRGDKLQEWLDEQLIDTKAAHAITLWNLNVNLHITTTDAATGKPLLLDKVHSSATTVAEAVRASTSIPLVFWETRVNVDGVDYTCWDGGTTGNCRFDIAEELYPNRLTIASSVTYRGEPQFLRASIMSAVFRPLRVVDHILNVALRNTEEQAYAILRRHNPSIRRQLIIVRPPFSGVSTFSFRMNALQRERLYENGSIATAAAFAEFRRNA
jgi:predicted acylesterase/phospholipase RssA